MESHRDSLRKHQSKFQHAKISQHFELPRLIEKKIQKYLYGSPNKLQLTSFGY